MRHDLVFGVAVLVAGLSGNAIAGVVVTSTQTQLDTHQASPMIVYADTDRIKVVTPKNTMIFRGDINRMWVIDTDRRSYMEMTPESLQQMGGQLAGAQAQLGAANAQLQARLAQMPPEQRAMMEKMMAGRGLGGAPAGQPPAPPQISFAKAGGSKTVAGWKCDVYRKTVNGQQEEELCIAPISLAGLTASDFQVLDRLSSFVAPVMSSPMLPRSDYMDWNEMNKAVGFQGMPLDTTRYVGGQPSVQETVVKVERAAIPASAFELPEGFTKRDMGIPPR